MAFTKAGRYNDIFINGKPAPSVDVTILKAGVNAVLYLDRLKTTVLTSSVVRTDSGGNLAFYANPGYYDLLVNGVSYLNITVDVDFDEITTQAELDAHAHTGTYVAYVAAPVGVVATDTAAWQAAADALPNGGLLIPRPGEYLMNLTGSGVTLYNGTTVWLPAGTTLKAGPNIATGAGTYIMFSPKSATVPADINFVGEGTFDGNKRGGNYGASEVIFAIALSGAFRSKVQGGLRFYNWRGEGVFFGRIASPSRVPTQCKVLGNHFEDCGVQVGGAANVNPRAGLTFIAGKDCVVSGNDFDTVGQYGVDLEGDTASDTFDGFYIGGNTYRNCPQGEVNVTTPGTMKNITVTDRMGASLPNVANLFVVPSGLARVVTKKKQAAGAPSITLNSAAWTGVSNADFDITMPAQAGDIIEYAINFYIDVGTQFVQFDVATIVSGSVARYFSRGAAAPNAGGVGAWRWKVADGLIGLGGPIWYPLTTADITVAGTHTTVTLRIMYQQNAANAQALYYGEDVAAAVVYAKNLGPGW